MATTVHVIDIGTPIEKCPICKSAVCRVVLGKGENRSIAIVDYDQLPDEKSNKGRVHACAIAVDMLGRLRSSADVRAQHATAEKTARRMTWRPKGV